MRAQSALAILLSEDDLVDAADEVALGAAPTPEAALADARARRPDSRRSRRAARRRTACAATTGPTTRRRCWRRRRRSARPQTAAAARQRVAGGARALDSFLRRRISLRRPARAPSRRRGGARPARRSAAPGERRGAHGVRRRAQRGREPCRRRAPPRPPRRRRRRSPTRPTAAAPRTNIEVIDAERQARDAESQVALAEDAARQARLDLLVATGAFP